MNHNLIKPGSNAVRSRSSNRQAVLGHIQSAGQMGRAEIARSLGLSIQAVSNIIADLEGSGLILEAGRRSAGRGLPAVQYGINSSGGYALGIEMRPDAIFSALVDLEGKQVASLRRAIVTNKPERLLAACVGLRDEIIKKTGIAQDKIMGAGVVMPGPFGQTGLSGLGSDLDGWEGLDAQRLFEDTLNIPVELSNDANAAAMAEKIGQGLSHFAYIYFGAGLGLGIVDEGRLVRGTFGNAGEIGHITVMSKDGEMVSLESQLSRVSLQTFMDTETPLDIAKINTLFADGDPKLMEWLDAGASALSHALGIIENLFDPQTIILGGAMPESVVDQLISQVILPERSVANRGDNTNPRLLRGTCGRMTATLGAASFILNRAFTPQAASL
jgi:predicted NBD/HSP70 family sugar kinase